MGGKLHSLWNQLDQLMVIISDRLSQGYHAMIHQKDIETQLQDIVENFDSDDLTKDDSSVKESKLLQRVKHQYVF